MSLQKNFPKNRAYYFWAIFLTHMVSVDNESSETEKKLFGTLAYRMISKAGADVPVAPVGLLHLFLSSVELTWTLDLYTDRSS